MGLILLLAGGGNLSLSATDGITATDAVTVVALQATDGIVTSEAIGDRSFSLTDSIAASEAATGGAPPSVALTATQELVTATDALVARSVATTDGITVSETATVGFANNDFFAVDGIFLGEAGFVTNPGGDGNGGLFNETIRRDRELWNRRFQPGRAV
jgi:hypothetical protein